MSPRIVGVCLLIFTLLIPATISSAEHPHPPGLAKRPHGHLRTTSPAEGNDNASLAMQAGTALAALLPGMPLIAQPEALAYRLDAPSLLPVFFHLPPPDQPPRLIAGTGFWPVP